MGTVEVHRLGSGGPLWLNPHHISGVEFAYGSDVFAEVWVGGSGIRVVESPAEVLEAWMAAV